MGFKLPSSRGSWAVYENHEKRHQLRMRYIGGGWGLTFMVLFLSKALGYSIDLYAFLLFAVVFLYGNYHSFVMTRFMTSPDGVTGPSERGFRSVTIPWSEVDEITYVVNKLEVLYDKTTDTPPSLAVRYFPDEIVVPLSSDPSDIDYGSVDGFFVTSTRGKTIFVTGFGFDCLETVLRGMAWYAAEYGKN